MKKLLFILSFFFLFSYSKAQVSDVALWLPDYGIYTNSVVVDTTFDEWCDYNEGCLDYGYNLVLNFITCFMNMGPDDIVFGDPVGASWAHNDPCHGHPHNLEWNIYYELWNNCSTVVVASHKQGFEVIDNFTYSLNPSNGYSSSYQGQSVLWGDCYGGVGCQYLKIHGQPAGYYTIINRLELTTIDQGANIHSDTAYKYIYFDGTDVTVVSSIPFMGVAITPTNLQANIRTLTWDGPLLQGYRIYRSLGKNPHTFHAPQLVGQTIGNSFIDANAPAPGWYRYHIVGVNDCGESFKSNFVVNHLKGNQ